MRIQMFEITVLSQIKSVSPSHFRALRFLGFFFISSARCDNNSENPTGSLHYSAVLEQFIRGWCLSLSMFSRVTPFVKKLFPMGEHSLYRYAGIALSSYSLTHQYKHMIHTTLHLQKIQKCEHSNFFTSFSTQQKIIGGRSLITFSPLSLLIIFTYPAKKQETEIASKSIFQMRSSERRS